jgi:Lon protease-like protein
MSSRLPLFPLPNLMLYPSAMVPLHLFEPRYLQLMEDLLEDGKREMVVGTLLPGWEDEYFNTPPIAKVVGVGEIMQHQKDEHGNFNILLRGKYRAVVVDETLSGRPYRLVDIEPHLEQEISADSASAAHERLLAAIATLAGATPQGAETQSVNYLTDILLVHLPMNMEKKLAAFCELSPLERARRVLEDFEQQQNVGQSFPRPDQTPEDPQWN